MSGELSPDLVARGRYEVAEDRRIAALMRGQHNRDVLLQRAQVTEDLVAEVERLRLTLDRVRGLATTYTPSPDLVEAIVDFLDNPETSGEAP